MSPHPGQEGYQEAREKIQAQHDAYYRELRRKAGIEQRVNDFAYSQKKNTLEEKK